MTSVPEAPVPAKAVHTRVVLSQADIDRALTRIAHEILESNKGSQDLVLLGIPRRGYPLAVRLAKKIAAADPTVDPAAIVGQLDVTMFRDDLSHQPTRPPYPTQLPRTGIDNKVVVLVDDVLYSGRTIRAALDAIIDLGRPRIVRLAVLIDRGHRELPIRADHVGKNLPTSSAEKVRVRLEETDPVGSGPTDAVGSAPTDAVGSAPADAVGSAPGGAPSAAPGAHGDAPKSAPKSAPNGARVDEVVIEATS